MPKPITPYERLRDRCHRFAIEVKHPKNYFLWEFPKTTAIQVNGFPEAIHALNTVGFEMHVAVSAKGGLEFRAVEKRPIEPWEIRV